MSRRRPGALALLALLALTGLAGCGGASQPAATSAGPSSALTSSVAAASSSGSSSSGSSSSGSSSSGARTTGSPSLLVFGDSYVAGTGADSARTSFAHRVGKDLDWPTTVDGVGGTGYLNAGPGPTAHDYLTRLRALPADELTADVVVVEGGLNDRGFAASAVQQAAITAFGLVHQRDPDATVVAVGATAPDPTRVAQSVATNAAIAAAAEATGVRFVDPVAENWLPAGDRRYVRADDVHPTQAGHDRIAGLLAADLRTITGAG